MARIKGKIIATGLTLLGLFLLGSSFLLFLGFFESPKAGISIESIPVAKVFIENKEVGTTPYEIELKPQEIMVKIQPISIDGEVFDDYETKVSLVPGVKTIIKRNFKENEKDSSGATVSFEKAGKNESIVTVVSIPDSAKVLIDGKLKGYSPLKMTVPAGDHDLEIEYDKYLPMKLPIRIYTGYKLTAVVKLASLENKNTIKVVESKTNQKIKQKVKIKENEVGFLRVRMGAGIGFPEIGQVKPGEEYEVIGEGENGKWYKIQLVDVEGLPAGRQGWVSADFVTKI